jgi:hypothetical protein
VALCVVRGRVYASRNLFTPVGPTSPCLLTNSVIDLFLYAQRCRNRSLGARALNRHAQCCGKSAAQMGRVGCGSAGGWARRVPQGG